MRTSSLFRRAAHALMLTALTVMSFQAARAQDDNPRVPNVEAAYGNLKITSEFLGFHLAAGAPAANTDTKQHWQGIARSPGSGQAYLYVTRSGKNESGRYSNLAVVEMMSRDKTGGRLRSNRLRTDGHPADAPPLLQDRVVTNYSFTDYNHPGGVQRIGDILVVPLEDRTNDSSPEGLVAFFDLTNPRVPVRLPRAVAANHKIGVIAIARLSDGKYLLALTWGDGDRVDFLLSNSTNLRDPNLSFSLLRAWTPSNLISGNWFVQNYDFTGQVPIQGTYQMLNFITQTDGTLYLMAARSTLASGLGQDHMQLFRVTNPGTSSINLQEVRQFRHMNCPDNNGNFGAGAGVHVTDNGELLLYSCEYYNSGADDTVKVGEFASIFNGAADRDNSSAWIEMYEDNGYNGDRLTLDSRDRLYGIWNRLSQMQGAATSGDFNDKATSVIWHAPPGTIIRAYENDNFTGAYLEFTGDGANGNIGTAWNDRISSVRIVQGDPGPTLLVPSPNIPSMTIANALLDVIGSLPFTQIRLLQYATGARPTVTKKTVINASGIQPSIIGLNGLP